MSVGDFLVFLTWVLVRHYTCLSIESGFSGLSPLMNHQDFEIAIKIICTGALCHTARHTLYFNADSRC